MARAGQAAQEDGEIVPIDVTILVQVGRVTPGRVGVSLTVETFLQVSEVGLINVVVFVEIGPGEVLTGLMRRIERNTERNTVNSPEGVQRFAASLR